MENDLSLPGEKAGLSGESTNDPISAVADLIIEASDVSDDTRGLFEPPKPKNKRGRPKKILTDQAAPIVGETTIEPTPLDSTMFIDPCKTIFTVASAGLVRYVGSDAVKLMPEEIQGLGESWSKVCAKYAPLIVSRNVELIFALGLTTQIAFRISNAAQVEIEKRKSEKSRTLEVVGNPVTQNA